MADSEWLNEWKEKFRELNKEEPKVSTEAFDKKKNAETLQFMKEALESGEEKIPGLQVRYDVVMMGDYDDVMMSDYDDDVEAIAQYGFILGDAIVINIGDEHPDFLSDVEHSPDFTNGDLFAVSTADMAVNAESRDTMLSFLDRFMDERVVDYELEADGYFITEDDMSDAHVGTSVFKDSGLYSPKDSEGNYINVSGEDLTGYEEVFTNAWMLDTDPYCITTSEERAELTDMKEWMKDLEVWGTDLGTYENEEFSVADDDALTRLRDEKTNAVISFMKESMRYADKYPGKDWAELPGVSITYGRDDKNTVDWGRIKIDIAGNSCTVSLADLAEDSKNRKTMTKFLTRFTDMTADDLNKRLEDDFYKRLDGNAENHKATGDIDKLKDNAAYGGWNFEPEAAGNTEQMKPETKQRKPEPGMTTGGWTFESENADGKEKSQPCRNPIPSEWKDMVAGNGMQDTNDKDYGD